MAPDEKRLEMEPRTSARRMGLERQAAKPGQTGRGKDVVLEKARRAQAAASKRRPGDPTVRRVWRSP